MNSHIHRVFSSRFSLLAGAVCFLAMPHAILLGQNDQGDDAQYLMDSTAADLASPDAATADKAEKQLIGIGVPAIPAVQKIMGENRSPQVGKRGTEILSALESKFKMDPMLVTLKLDDVPPRKVFAELSRQGGVRADGQWNFWDQNQQNRGRQMSVDFRNEPFAQALYEAVQKGKVDISDGNRGNMYELQENYSTPHVYPTCLSGPMFFSAQSIQRLSEIDFGDKSESDELSIQLHVISDPQLPLARTYTNVVVTEAIGDTGQSLIDPQNNGPDESTSWTMDPNFTSSATISLKFKTGQNKIIKSLKGDARFCIASPTTKFVFADPAVGKSLTQGDWTVSIREFSIQNGQYYANIEAKNSQGRGNSSASGLCKLFDANGMPYIYQSRGGGRGSDTVQFYAGFLAEPQGGNQSAPTSIGKPSKLEVIVGSNVRPIRIPFEFHDLAIPSPGY